MVTAAEASRKVVEISRDADSRVMDLLIDNSTLTEQDFKRVIAAQRERGECFSDAALRLGLVTEPEVRRALARQCEVPATLPDNKTYHRKLVVAHQPYSPRTEAMRSLRSELLLRWFSRGKQVLAVSEAHQDHGADALAANLAWSFAQLGRRTVLIEANMRKPQQQSLFKLESKVGLSDFLKGQCGPGDVLNPVPGFNQLSIIFAGSAPPNPQELLSQASFGFLLESVQTAFDIVIIVGPALLECADTQTIASRSGGCILSTRRHRTSRAEVEAAASKLSPTGATLVGVVIDG